ncbi:hypothetical protein EVA_14235 [gut metagenome]|uniref:Uncharacterized protein n=1 Tax=gut metagenome TaxID=749906 RepID=J9FT34_9ZZZZ
MQFVRQIYWSMVFLLKFLRIFATLKPTAFSLRLARVTKNALPYFSISG